MRKIANHQNIAIGIRNAEKRNEEKMEREKTPSATSIPETESARR